MSALSNLSSSPALSIPCGLCGAMVGERCVILMAEPPKNGRIRYAGRVHTERFRRLRNWARFGVDN